MDKHEGDQRTVEPLKRIFAAAYDLAKLGMDNFKKHQTPEALRTIDSAIAAGAVVNLRLVLGDHPIARFYIIGLDRKEHDLFTFTWRQVGGFVQ